MTSIIATQPERGLVILYTPGEPSACPNCAQRHWHIGRKSASCAACDWTCDLAEPAMVEPIMLGEAA